VVLALLAAVLLNLLAAALSLFAELLSVLTADGCLTKEPLA
jgi:hypothetical protein